MLLYVAFFLPTSIHTAWLSMTAANAVLMVPAALQYDKLLEGGAAFLAVLVTAIGKFPEEVLQNSEKAPGLSSRQVESAEIELARRHSRTHTF